MTKKKLLIMGDYFYPDVASTGQLLTELCLELQNEFDITVLTSVPSFKQHEYIDILNHEKYQNINLLRIKTAPFKKTNKYQRIKHIIEYYFLIRKAIRHLEPQDIIFTISQPPILGGLQGRYAQKVQKGKLVYCIHDFNPEQAEAVGIFKYKFIYRVLRYIDNVTCKRADRIVLVGRDMFETVEKRGFDGAGKMTLINNWIDEEKIYPSESGRVREFREKYGLKDKLVIMYSGNIGLYYDLENIIKVFCRFKDNKDVVFTFIGDGAKKNQIQEYAEDAGAQNIIFIPFQDKEDILYSLNAADVHLVTNSKGIKGVSVPSKIYGVMAVGKYVLGVLEKGSEAEKLISDCGCGVVVEPGEYEDLETALKTIINTDREKLKEYGLKGRRLLEDKFKKADAITRYRTMFNEY